MNKKAVENIWWVIGGAILVIVILLIYLFVAKGGWEILKNILNMAPKNTTAPSP